MASDKPAVTVLAEEGDGKSAAPKSAGVIAAAASATFSGPIPPPQLLAEYEKISPGLADRLVRMAEDEAAHRRSIEVKVTDAQIEDMRAGRREGRWGQVFALVITLAGIGAGAYTAAQGHEIAGSVLGAFGVGGIVTTFVLGRSKTREENAAEAGKGKADKQAKKR